MAATAATVCGCLSANFLAGTQTHSYEPAIPSSDGLDGLAVQVTQLELTDAGPGVSVDVILRADTTAQIAGAILTAAAAAPCSVGVVATSLALDDWTRWDRPVGVSGTHAVRFAFDGGAPLLAGGEMVLDLRMVQIGGGSDGPQGSERCVRLPLGAPQATRAWNPAPRRWSVGAVLRAGLSANRSRSRPIDDELRLQYWFQHVLVGLEAGWSLEQCEGGACDPSPGVVLPAWLLAEAIPIRVRGFGFGVQAAYGVGYGIRRASDWARAPDLIVHGPRLTLHLLRLTPALYGAGGATGAKGLELSVAYQTAARGAVPAALMIGVGLVAF
ncbi:MAG: hypothetical protein ABJA82_04585 [Myxococcales bacterium]